MSSLVSGLGELLGANVAGLNYSLLHGGNVFEQDWPNEPDLAVQINSAGGPEPSAKRPSDDRNVQLIFRANPEDPTGATDLWQRVFDYLHALRRVTLPGGDILVWALVQQAEPIRLGADENGRQRFSMNLVCRVQHVSGHRTV